MDSHHLLEILSNKRGLKAWHPCFKEARFKFALLLTSRIQLLHFGALQGRAFPFAFEVKFVFVFRSGKSDVVIQSHSAHSGLASLKKHPQFLRMYIYEVLANMISKTLFRLSKLLKFAIIHMSSWVLPRASKRKTAPHIEGHRAHGPMRSIDAHWSAWYTNVHRHSREVTMGHPTVYRSYLGFCKIYTKGSFRNLENWGWYYIFFGLDSRSTTQLLDCKECRTHAKTNPEHKLSLRGSIERQAQHIHGRGTRYRTDAPKTQEEPQKTKAHYRANVEEHATTLPCYRDESIWPEVHRISGVINAPR